MARLPQPGSDSGQWGQILNDFLVQIHNTDGTLKDNVVDSGALAPGAVNASNVAAPGGVDGQVLVKDSTQASGLNWAASSGTGVTDHGALSGLGDDDHPQYHNDTRGDDRYYTKAQVDASLAGKANDVSVVKTTGNQAITGTKNFSALEVGGQAIVTDADSRLSDDRAPLDDSVTEPKIAATNDPTSGQVLSYDGAALTWSTPDALTSLPMGGELGGTTNNATINDGVITAAKLSTVTAASAGKVLGYTASGLDWVSSGAGSVTMGGDLSGAAGNAQIVAGAVGSAELASNAVTNVKMADNSVGTAELIADSVTNVKMADNSVGTAELITGSITEAKLDAAVQTKLNAAAGGVEVQAMGAAAGTRQKVNFIEGSNVRISAVDNSASERVDVTISSAGAGGAADATTTSKGIVQLAGDLTGSAVAPAVAAGAITTAKIADGNVTAPKIADGNVTTAKIADANVTTAKIALGAVTPGRIDTVGAPTNGQVLSYDGTAVKMAWIDPPAGGGGPVTLAGDITGDSSATSISAGVVGTTELADLGVTSAKIANLAIGTAKIANNAVDSTKLANGSVSYAKITPAATAAGQHLSYNGTSLAWVDPSSTILTGSGAPDDTLGTNGDVYVDTDTNDFYGPKTAGAWPAGQSLVGPSGATGPAGPEGISPPPFAQLGTLSTGTGTVRWYNDTGATLNIGYVRAVVGTPATGSSIIVDVNISGTSIFTTSPKPAIAVNVYTKKVTAFDTTTIANGQYFTVDIDQVGSTVAGSDLYVTIGLSRS